jgi:hypothetical protein
MATGLAPTEIAGSAVLVAVSIGGGRAVRRQAAAAGLPFGSGLTWLALCDTYRP